MMLDNLWRRLVRGIRRATARPDWEAALGPDWETRVMDLPATDRFHAKQGRSTGRLILNAGGAKLSVYLKRHYRLSRWSGLLAAFFPGGAWSPGVQEERRLQRARDLGVPVPEVVAVGETVGPWGRLKSFLAVEELHDMLPLHEAIPLAHRRLDPRSFAEWKRALIVEMVRLTKLLHDAHEYHNDLYFCHFYIPRGDTGRLTTWRGRVHLIDFHRLAHHPRTGLLRKSKDLAQLLYSSDVAGVTARDRVRFERLYRGTAQPSFPARLLRRIVLFRCRRYQRHNARRPQIVPVPVERVRAS